jgi:hypothetical protein
MTFELIRDLHKDARGFRPSAEWMEMFNTAAQARQQAIWDMLCEELAENEAREQEARAAAIVRFEARVSDLISMGAGDRATALRWIADAEDCADDLGHLCYRLGLPYNYFDMKEAA